MYLPPSARRVAALQDPVKRARDEENPRRAAQRDKRARVEHQDVQEVSVYLLVSLTRIER